MARVFQLLLIFVLVKYISDRLTRVYLSAVRSMDMIGHVVSDAVFDWLRAQVESGMN